MRAAANQVAFLAKINLTDGFPEPLQPTTERNNPTIVPLNLIFVWQYFPNNVCDRPSLRAGFFPPRQKQLSGDIEKSLRLSPKNMCYIPLPQHNTAPAPGQSMLPGRNITCRFLAGIGS